MQTITLLVIKKLNSRYYNSTTVKARLILEKAEIEAIRSFE